ncbi:putative pre-mRNA-splicing factor ATP-dependent RNA helicase DHX32 [Protopterus annectens]|uniref:putative pre-mRNA-splicing factor ATP-dependent RNA helicase DHX32 n=1 Tax=Protopterus annectens TaxID=7888 RepID=UPI001CFA5041|nr:putative pre-mRNA-splicing factor ATP-dependent RNA helicase DHX32 [Protopterus annectens]
MDGNISKECQFAAWLEPLNDDEDVHAKFAEDLESNPFDGLPYSSRYYKLLKERQQLLVWSANDIFRESLSQNQLIIVSGDAKSGKSSQVPQWCAEYCLSTEYHQGVVCTQVHQQTAVTLALRVADEMDVNIGHEVGYSIPFENCCTCETILRYCTDEVLLREMMSNPFLEYYGVIIIDETHERTVATDVFLGLLKDILTHRTELRVVIITVPYMADTLWTYLGEIPIIQLKSECSSEVVYSCSAEVDYFISALKLLFEIHSTGEKGDIVVFFASEQEVAFAHDIIRQEGSRLCTSLGELLPVPLYPRHGGCIYKPKESQENDKPYKRMVLLTTSHGESLIWMDSVTFVIDVGVEKKNVYNPRIRAHSLVVRPISKCQADKRKNVLSRSRPGKCFCLYTEEFKSRHMPQLHPPCIQESDLINMVLFLKRMDIAGLRNCRFRDRPAPEGLMQALEDLDYLAALDNDGNLSEIGIIMSEFPLDPKLAKALLASCEFDCVDEMLTIAAMVTAPNCFQVPLQEAEDTVLTCLRNFMHPEGDHFTLINVYNAYKQSKAHRTSQDSDDETWCSKYFLNYSALKMADIIRDELVDIMNRTELPISGPAFGVEGNILNIKKALLSGYFMQVAREVDGSGNYIMLNHKQAAQLHPLSGYLTMKGSQGLPEWVIFQEFTISESNYIKTVSHISPDMFVQLVPQYYFYNLPPSESKDILQEMLHQSSMPNEQQKHTSSDHSSNDADGKTEERCSIQ